MISAFGHTGADLGAVIKAMSEGFYKLDGWVEPWAWTT
jgi:hypothetical protein